MLGEDIYRRGDHTGISRRVLLSVVEGDSTNRPSFSNVAIESAATEALVATDSARGSGNFENSRWVIVWEGLITQSEDNTYQITQAISIWN